MSENGGSERGRGGQTMKQHMIRGKIEKFLKTVLDLTLFVQNKHFSRLE